MREAVQQILAEILRRHRSEGRVHLDDMAEVIGTRAVSYDEVDALIAALEAEGLRVGEDLDDGDIARMQAILASARGLRKALGRAPTVREVAEAAAAPEHVVRRALKEAQRAARPKP
ncbi:MAG: hypothetical protein U0359_32580 [Byssovorax sp.]